MKLASTISIYGGGTSEGASKGWDARGRGRKSRASSGELSLTVKRHSSNNFRVLAGDFSGKEVGWVEIGVREEGRKTHLVESMLDEKYRGKGYGRKMYIKAIDFLKRYYPKAETLESSFPLSTEAERVWRSLAKSHKVVEEYNSFEQRPHFTLRLK